VPVPSCKVSTELGAATRSAPSRECPAWPLAARHSPLEPVASTPVPACRDCCTAPLARRPSFVLLAGGADDHAAGPPQLPWARARSGVACRARARSQLATPARCSFLLHRPPAAARGPGCAGDVNASPSRPAAAPLLAAPLSFTSRPPPPGSRRRRRLEGSRPRGLLPPPAPPSHALAYGLGKG
jgi:hypothetical protein